ncbi:glycosyl hydrolase family 95 catalytic domain-containing protein [Catenuloplanes sp. NPDC051500]|uniref:glycosyl hydrolase family 95 catalytic domain-containing protein n=1 Tax=Catenuloplanes sp. NPDC051500 TaxID=3363959 RepID=UPI00379EC337
MDLHTDLRPAREWEQAMISGNGRQGLLFWGGPEAIRLTLSHERLFQPVSAPLPPPDTAAILPELRGLLSEGRFQDAADLVCAHASAGEPGYRELRWVDPLIGAATLTFTPRSTSQTPGGYARSTDFATGVVTQRWGGVVCEAFVSRADDVVVLRVSGTGGELTLAPVDGVPERPIDVRVDGLTLDAVFPGADWPGALPGYRVECRVERYDDGLLVLARTVVGALPVVPPWPDRGFDELLAAHVAVHGEWYRRFRLDLGGDHIGLLVNACRYAAISASGELPPTLQGVWSGGFRPPWRSAFTLDGNLPAAVQGFAPTGTPELLLPVLALAEARRPDMRVNARRLYGVGGLLAPAHQSTHALVNHFGPRWCQTFWTAGAAWLARLFTEYYEHTGDEVFLRERAVPFLAEVAEFYLDFVTVSAGRARFAPSYSPENAPVGTGSQACVDATMDVAAAGGLLRDLLRFAPGDPQAPRWRALRDALPPFRVSGDGLLAEWVDPALRDAPGHRHASHLYPLWYGGDPAFDDPRLARAAGAAIRARLDWWDGQEADEMAYGLAQLGIAAAHLGLRDEAFRALSRLAERYFRPSLVPTHNRDAVFNVDIAGALPALVAAMLVRSRPGRVDLLPALPREWPRGEVSGLVARGPVHIVRLAWSPDGFEAVLTAPRPLRTVLAGPGLTSIELDLNPGIETAVNC